MTGYDYLSWEESTKVTAIKAGACRKQPKLKQVVIGKNVKTIRKTGFLSMQKIKEGADQIKMPAEGWQTGISENA